MNTNDVTNLRLQHQFIVGNGGTALSVVEHMGAMQAQDYGGALWSIGLRTGLTQKQVVASIEKGEIVRTWPQRGTLHFVPACDAKWLVSLSEERLIRGAATRQKRLGLDEATLAKCKQVLSDALAGGKKLSRPKIMETLERLGIGMDSNRGYYILWNLSQTGVLVVGPMEGKQQTFALLDEWAKHPKKYSREAGIAELAKRYFTSHGPATLQDFMWWTGLTSVDAKAGLEANKKILISETYEKKEYWMKPRTEKETSALERAFLLPGFDEYMLGYKDRSAALHQDHKEKIIPGGNGIFLGTIVLAGQVRGTWKKEIKKDKVVIKLYPFKKLTKEEMKLLEQPVAEYGKFCELPALLA